MKDEKELSGLEPRSSSSLASPSRSESEFISILRNRASQGLHTTPGKAHSSFIPHPSSLLTGIGDDAAVIAQLTGRDTVITADLLIEDVDFIRRSIPPQMLGHKSLAVSLSDIAAMGARPRWALLSIGVPNEMWDSQFLDEFYEGFFALANRYDVQLVGGDVSRTPDKIVVDSIVLGECSHERSVLRRGARAGDALFVTGALGGSAAGLRLLQRGARVEVRD